MEKSVAHGLLKTFAFFDLFAYPLTSYEAWKWLISNAPVPLTTTLAALDELVHRRALTLHKGFYCLPDRDHQIPQRRHRFRLAEQKWQKALAASSWLARFPFIRMIAIGNTLAYSNASKASDIDFLIVTEAGHIWTSRFFSASYFHFRGQRPTPHQIADTICLSFWITEERLNLQSVAIDANDIYLSYWIAQLVPVYDPDQLYLNFWKENRSLLQRLPHAQPLRPHQRRQIQPGSRSIFLQNTFEMLLQKNRGKWLERKLQLFQLRRLPPLLKNQMNQNNGVVINDHMLKFHDHDRRIELRQQWETHAQQLIQSHEHPSVATQPAMVR